MSYQFILVETQGRVGIVKLNRPDRLNALNDILREELVSAVDAFDADEKIGCIVITGSEKAFAAGADITQMVDATPVDMLRMCSSIGRIAKYKKRVFKLDASSGITTYVRW